MQRKLILTLILLAIAVPCFAVETDHINGIPVTSVKMRMGIWSISKIKAHNGFAIASALTCTVLSANSSYNATLEFAKDNTVQLTGIIWDDGASGSICSFKHSVYSVTGDMTTKDLYSEVWLLGASSELSTLIGRSDKVDGAAWSNALVAFAYSTPAAYDCAGSNQYGIIVKVVADGAAADSAGTYSATVYPIMRYSDETNTMTGVVANARWRSDTGALHSSDADDMPVAEVWTMQ